MSVAPPHFDHRCVLCETPIERTLRYRRRRLAEAITAAGLAGLTLGVVLAVAAFAILGLLRHFL